MSVGLVSPWRRLESRGDQVDRLGTDSGSFLLSRSRSMDHLPQRDRAPEGTSALRALFESKATLQEDFYSSTILNIASPASRMVAGIQSSEMEKDRPLGARRGYSTEETNGRKDNTQRAVQGERRKTISGVPESSVRGSRITTPDDKRSLQLSYRDTPSRQGRDRERTSSSVRDRSALYLSRVAAAESPGSSTHTKSISSSGKRTTGSKMAEKSPKNTVSEAGHEEDDLPLPPPPPIPPRPQNYEESPAVCGPNQAFIPVPPPKETFSTFYQQRQKNELKRLFKHIHPDLRENINDVVDDELVAAMQSGGAQTAADAGYQGEVQSMRWIFENWTLDNIGDHPHMTKKLLEDETLQGGDVRGTSSMFEHCIVDGTQQIVQRQSSVRGDVRTSTWLFETQPMDTLNKLQPEEAELVEAVLKEPMQIGDVRGTRLLFESKPLDALGRCSSVEDQSFLKLKSELQEQKGDVRKTVKLFQADPCCALRDASGNIHKIKSICREEICSSNISTARWLFETKPLDIINKGTSGMQIIRGISLEEGQKGGVDRKRWMFETQPFNSIREEGIEDRFQGTVVEVVPDADVGNKLKMFETQPLAALKGDSTEVALEKEEILGGDVKSSLWLFETQPMETLKECYEVGHLKKVILSTDEQGEVKGKKHMFENYNIRKENLVGEEIPSKDHEIEKGDVKSYKHLFETIPLCNITQSQEEVLNGNTENDITAGDVKGNRTLFETTPLYAIKDCTGNFHEVTTVNREECIKGSVQNYKWMFETKPIDQFEEGNKNVEVIKGITRQEDRSGDVKMTKWLFETQTIDGIHSKFNQSEQQHNSTEQQKETRKGDVKTCKWLFETQPVDILYDKSEKIPDKEEEIENTNVKSVTWLFESQPLDSIKDSEEQSFKLCSTIQDGVKAEVGVKTVKHLFETETLDRIRKDTDTEQDVRYVSELHVQSGDVSRVKEIFESKSLDEIGSESIKVCDEDESIQKGSVRKCTWLFENRPINTINDKEENGPDMHCVNDIEGGDVHNKKFIFETFSLDKIHDKDQFLEHKSESVEKPVSNVDVKSSTMLFESQPLYAIRDKEGQFHEVTTVQKEEVMSGDVRGARWMFETKPLDAIKAEKEIYVIRAVTQEDVKKGDVKSARWKFETQPLDSLTAKEEDEEPTVKVVEDFGNRTVKLNKQLFESDQSASKKCVRMVSVTDIQQGDVRTSTWLFENQPIDRLKGEPEEQGPVQMVHREDNQKGEVKRCTWLFESQTLDKIKDPESNVNAAQVIEEEIPKADVKSTTWLFETTPLDKIVTVESVIDTLSRLHQLEFIHSSGILIEAKEVTNVNMVKYQFIKTEGAQIQKEEIVEGNIRNIMLQLLSRSTLKPQITLLKEVEQGKVQTTVLEVAVNQPASTNQDNDQSVQKLIESLLVQDKLMKKGIIMQESEGGHVEMTVYLLLCQTKMDSQEITRGDVKSTIGNLLATANNQRTTASCRLDENEKGNVDLYRSCIEKGDLQKLKSLQIQQSELDELDLMTKEQIEIVQGDVKEAKKNLQKQKDQVERTISDVLPGDVKNAKRVFSTEGSIDLSVENCISKEEIIRGDISSAKQQLALKQTLSMEKEEIVAGDIKATLQSLERAKQQSMHLERDTITPGTIYDMDLATQGPESEGNQTQKEEIVSGDVKAAKQSLELAKNQSLCVERDIIVPGKIYNVNISSQGQSSTTVRQSASSSTSRGQRITTTFRKVSDAERDQEKIEACQQGYVSRSSDVIHVSTADSPPAVSGSTQTHPYVNSEFDDIERTGTEEAEAEVVRGDIKAAIRSLHSAATEQRPLVDKQEIVRGNMQMALQYLEKSSINVSKGDYKAAMLYRNSGYAGSRKKRDAETVKKQCVVVSMPPSDTELSPSVSVTLGEPPASAAQTSATVTFTNLDENPKTPSTEALRPPPLPPKANDKTQYQKPALPPKPQCSKQTPSDATDNPTPPPKTPSPIKGNQQSPVIPPKMKPGNPSPPPLPQKPSSNRQQTTKDSQPKCTKKAKQNSPQASATNNIPAEYKKSGQLKQKREQKNIGTTLAVDHHSAMSNGIKNEMDRNVIQKINAAKEIRMCMQSYTEDGDVQQEINTDFQVAIQNFRGKEKNVVDTAPVLPNKIKVIREKVNQEKQVTKNTNIQQEINPSTVQQGRADIHNQGCNTDLQEPYSPTTTDRLSMSQHNSDKLPGGASITVTSCQEEHHQRPEDKVVLRKKKEKKETEDQRRQRLSVHKDDIMRGNVKAAMEIFENLRKREELKTILSQVQEIEGETREVDVSSLKSLFENVPAWIVTPCKHTKQSHTKGEKKVEIESVSNDMESGSSVETVFGDLEKASKDIMHLKEQTLAKLIDIEEAIRKALYSVSNLKSEADIAGLSGLFNESLQTEQSHQPTNNIRKISIASTKATKAKTEPVREASEGKTKGVSGSSERSESTSLSPVLDKPQIKQSSTSPSSPSFISIHSAARKPVEQPKSSQPQFSSFKPKPERCPSPSSHGANGDLGQQSASDSPNHFYSPASPRRKVSILEVQTVPETVPAGIIGTKTVSEKYEEMDCFGNTFVSSKTSTFVTKHSEKFGVVTSPTRYEVVTSPIMQRSGHPFSENAKEGGTVFVTFGQPKPGKL
uniref:Xin actin binding repeat containing 1 n=4 Tax=Oncorhynchus kisutch TaxID=8019 RepID=A0A8C7KL41_ONCKI